MKRAARGPLTGQVPALLDAEELERTTRHLADRDAVSAQRSVRALLERLLKRTAKERAISIDGLDLRQTIDALADRRVIDAKAKKLAHRIRWNGNKAVHEASADPKVAAEDLHGVVKLATELGSHGPSGPRQSPSRPVAGPGVRSPDAGARSVRTPGTAQIAILLRYDEGPVPWSRVYRPPGETVGRNALRGTGVRIDAIRVLRLEAFDGGWKLTRLGPERVWVDGQELKQGETAVLKRSGTLRIATMTCTYELRREDA